MCRKGRRFTVLWLAILSAVLTACGLQPRSTYPVLEQTVESDADLDCIGFDDELLKANAIRDAVFEEHGDVIKDAYLGTAVDLVFDPIMGILSGIGTGLSTSKASKAYLEAAAAAGLRMEQMLVYKEEHNCRSRPTASSDLTDSIVLAQLQDLGSQLDQQEITQKEYVSERRALLDGLR